MLGVKTRYRERGLRSAGLYRRAAWPDDFLGSDTWSGPRDDLNWGFLGPPWLGYKTHGISIALGTAHGTSAGLNTSFVIIASFLIGGIKAWGNERFNLPSSQCYETATVIFKTSPELDHGD